MKLCSGRYSFASGYSLASIVVSPVVSAVPFVTHQQLQHRLDTLDNEIWGQSQGGVAVDKTWVLSLLCAFAMGLLTGLVWSRRGSWGGTVGRSWGGTDSVATGGTNTTEDATDGTKDGTTNDTADGTTYGSTNYRTYGTKDGTLNDTSDETAVDIIRGTTDDNSDDNTEDTTENTSDFTTEGAMDSIVDGIMVHRHSSSSWIENGGGELEPPLRSGAIALLDAQWLINFALNNAKAVLSPRQELPPEAFVSVDDLIRGMPDLGSLHTPLPIITLSHMWLTKSHPDPEGETLRNVALWCRALMQYYRGEKMGIFWDYASLYQRPRTQTQDALFREGLDSLADLFSHPQTYCFRVTQLPENYRLRRNLPPGANITPYNDRGWTFVESAWASLKGAPSQVFDISSNNVDRDIFKPGQAKTVPLLPETMAMVLKDKKFTNRNKDLPLTLRLYKDKFVRSFRDMEWMDYSEMGLSDEKVVNLASIIAAGYARNLVSIDLGNGDGKNSHRRNKFGVTACQALANALLSASLPKLQEIDLSGNEDFDDACMGFLAPALVKIESVRMNRCPRLGVAACQRLADAYEQETTWMSLPFPVQTRSLDLAENSGTGDKGVEILSTVIVRQMKIVHLNGCNVGNAGCRALAEACKACNTAGTPSPLEALILHDNPFIDERAIPHIRCIVSTCGRLERLLLPKRLESDATTLLLKSRATNANFFVGYTDETTRARFLEDFIPPIK